MLKKILRWSSYQRRLQLFRDLYNARPSGAVAAHFHRRHGHADYTVIIILGDEASPEPIISSLVRQTLDFRTNIRIICVNTFDGSNPAAERYVHQHPENIRLLSAPNSTAAEARQRALREVRTEWVTFAEAQDEWDICAFQRLDTALHGHPQTVVALANTIERDGNCITTEHPLNYCFRCTQAVSLSRAEKYPMNGVPGIFFRSERINAAHPAFTAPLSPHAADVCFYLRYLLACDTAAELLFLRRVKYYRCHHAIRQAEKQRLTHPSTYGADITEGYLPILQAADAQHRRICAAVFLYELCFYLQDIESVRKHTDTLPDLQQQELACAVRTCFRYLCVGDEEILPPTLRQAPLLRDIIRYGFFSKKSDTAVADISDVDVPDNLICLSFLSSPNAIISYQTDGNMVTPTWEKEVRYTFAGVLLCTRHYAWVPQPRHSASVQYNGEALPLRFNGKTYSVAAFPWESLRRQFPAIRISEDSPYAHALLFMDRLYYADDNAEHLYRYISRQAQERPLFYILAATSADWSRLEREGFRLLPFGTQEHKQALRECDAFISSHLDIEQTDPFGTGELKSKKYIFLQHGVTHNDVHLWLNKTSLGMFVTTTPAEHESIINPYSFYKQGKKEVKLVGFPRHDALLQKDKPGNRQILIMPTWRGFLRNATPSTFAASEYVRRWKEFLHHPYLEELHQQHGYRIVFYLHPQFRKTPAFVAAFECPAHVEIPTADLRYQELFTTSSIGITDYTSAVFDMALLQKALLYYQFDREHFFAAHGFRPGYFDYDHDGFGPVARTAQEMADNLRAVIINGGHPTDTYRERMQRTFPFRDGKNCERTYQAIRELR